MYLHYVHNPSRTTFQTAAKNTEQLIQTQERHETVWKTWFKSPHFTLRIISQKNSIWEPLSWRNMQLSWEGMGGANTTQMPYHEWNLQQRRQLILVIN